MTDGIYEVNFRSSIQDFGSGLIVIKSGAVNGGDAHFLYRGTIAGDTGEVSANIAVDQWKAGNRSVVGIRNFNITFTGTIDNDTLKLSGRVESQPQLVITVTGRRVADAA